MLKRIAILISLLLVGATAQTHLDFQQSTLSNGLRVILSVDHSAPTISFTVMYDVGSRNEKPGRTGFAHLFEHLMFEGSENVGKGEYYYYIFTNGGDMNGTTTKDRTVYYETLPANQIDLGLFLESDRMRALSITQDKLDNQRKAVKEERRLSVDNQPYGPTFEDLDQLAYDNPAYKHSVIGSMTDLNAATLTDVRSFFRTYYAPNNAVLVLVGDFDPTVALAKIKTRFGLIPRQPAPPPVDMTEAPQTAERRQTVEDTFANLPLLNLAYHVPASDSPDFYALDVLGDILASGRSSRMYTELVDGRQMAAGVSAGPDKTRGPSLFHVEATVRPGTTPAALETALEADIAKVQASGVTAAEVDKALTQDRTELIESEQGTLSRALALATGAIFYKDANYVNEEMDDYNRVTPADVQRVAREYLTAANRTVLTTTPAPGKAAGPAAPAPSPSKAVELSQVVHLGRAPVSTVVLQPKLPKPVESRLPNGLQVLILEDHRLPLVTASMEIWGAGSLFAPADQPALASMAANLSTLGTDSRSAADIAAQTAALGASLGSSAPYGGLAASVGASGRSDNFSQWFALAEDVLLHPSYPQDELDKAIARGKIGLRSSRTSPAFLASERFNQVVYGKFPAAIIAPTEAQLGALTRDQLVAWHRQQYDPENAILAIAGDVNAATLLPQLQRDFQTWVPTGASDHLDGAPTPSHARQISLIDRPGSVQTTLAVGNIGLDRLNPDYFADMVLNQVLGAGPQSRLFLNLREAHGYTYGVYSSINPQRFPGAWRAGGDVRTAVTGDALTQIIHEITRLRTDPVPVTELDAAKRSIVSSFALSLESPTDVVSYAIDRKLYGFPTDYWDTYPAQISAVTAADVQRLALRYYNPDTMQIVAVGDAAAVKDALAKFGPVQVYGTDGKPKP